MKGVEFLQWRFTVTSLPPTRHYNATKLPISLSTVKSLADKQTKTSPKHLWRHDRGGLSILGCLWSIKSTVAYINNAIHCQNYKAPLNGQRSTQNHIKIIPKHTHRRTHWRAKKKDILDNYAALKVPEWQMKAIKDNKCSIWTDSVIVLTCEESNDFVKKRLLEKEL
jgi:hypothetical protein